VLEGVEGRVKVFFRDFNDPEQVVAFDAFGISGEFVLNFLFGFFRKALLEQGLRFLEPGIDFWSGRPVLNWSLCVYISRKG
jgi:hypothetical protein